MRSPHTVCRLLCLAFVCAAGTVLARTHPSQAPAAPEGRDVAAGASVSVSSRLGALRVRTADGDRVLASASDRSGRAVPIRFSDQRGSPPALRVEIDTSGEAEGGPFTLEVLVPASCHVVAGGDGHPISVEGVASLEVRTVTGEISVRTVRGVVDAETASGSIEVEGTRGDVRVRSGNGDVLVRDVSGRVEVTTGNGNVEVARVEGDVRVSSINARIDVRCVRGRLDVSDTSGVAEISAVDGDVDALSSMGKVSYRGVLYPGRRYRLRTLSGAVRFVAEGTRSGFRGELTTFSGPVEIAGITAPADADKARKNRRVVVQHGAGLARVELDAFDGRLSLIAIEAEPRNPCAAVPAH